MQLPLLFNFRQVVTGVGFIADVQVSGRALLGTELGEAEETWITAVAPVGWAGGGTSRTAAFDDFRRGWVQVVFDIAAESTSFGDFKSKCSEFLSSAHEGFTIEWNGALEQVRAGKYEDDELPSVPADQQPVGFQIAELEPGNATPDSNRIEDGLKAAA